MTKCYTDNRILTITDDLKLLEVEFKKKDYGNTDGKRLAKTVARIQHNIFSWK